MIISAYLNQCLDINFYNNTVDKVYKRLLPHKDEFDSIAFMGASGTLIGPNVAANLQRHMIMVRKDDIRSHSYYEVEGYCYSEKYVIIDDCITTGNTIVNILEKIKKMNETYNPGKECRCYGVCLYLSNSNLEETLLRRVSYPVKIL